MMKENSTLLESRGFAWLLNMGQLGSIRVLPKVTANQQQRAQSVKCLPLHEVLQVHAISR